MRLKIEFRFSVLTCLVIFLWLTIEYAIGLQDKFIGIQPYLSFFAVNLIIPAVCYTLALNEKLEEFGRITFKQAFITGFIITLFTCILLVPTQLLFHRLINPDFFEAMIQYTAKNTKQSMETAAMYFNLKTYIIQSVLFNFVFGIIVSLILAWRVKTN